MKLNEYKITYEDFSGKASDVVRQLSFAGIAVIWIFKVQSNGSLKIPDSLLTPLMLFCISLALDLLQYFLGYLIWYAYFKYNEIKGASEDQEIKHHEILPVPLHFCMFAKIICTIIAYYILIVFIFNSLV